MKINSSLIGIDRNYWMDSFYGILTFIGIFLLSFIAPGISTIGVPQLAQSISSVVGKGIVIILLSPIFESFFFFVIVLGIFHQKLKLPYFVSAIISSIIFVIFHISAYGLSGTSGAFFSAFVMGMVFAYQTKLTNSVIPMIITHAFLNAVIGNYLPFSVVVSFLPSIGGII